MPYQAVIQGWHDFYVVAATSAATLVGLLFVGLSLHLHFVVARADVRSLARVTLTNFGLVLFYSLFTVIPQGAGSTGEQLVISGAVSFALIARSLVAAARAGATHTFGLALVVLRIGTSVLAYAGVIAAGVLLANGQVDAGLSVQATATFVLLVVSLRNSWDLLVTVGEATRERS